MLVELSGMEAEEAQGLHVSCIFEDSSALEHRFEALRARQPDDDDFDRADRNRDGVVDRSEWQAFKQAASSGSERIETAARSGASLASVRYWVYGVCHLPRQMHAYSI